MKKIKSLFLGKKYLSIEDERRLIEEVVKDDEARKARLVVTETEKQKIREANRVRKRVEIERKIREKYLYGERREIEAQLKGKEVEGEKVAAQQMEVAGKVIRKTADAHRVRESDAIRTRYGYTIVYKKVFQGPYWRVLQARRKDQIMALTIVDLMKAPSEKKDNLIRIGFKITRFLASNLHPTLLNVYDLFLVDTEYYLFHEMMETYLEKFMRHGSVVSELRASIWGWELADAITYLHSHGIAHRNISPKTVWMNKSLQIKLGNFSYSTVFWDYVNKRKIPVTRIHMKEADFHPPEESGTDFHPPESGTGMYDAAKADVWMWAATVVYTLTKKYPPKTGFTDFKDPHLANLSDDGTALLASALQTDFSKRPSASSILHNIWFKPFLSNPSAKV